MAKAKVSTHKSRIEDFFKPAHVTIFATDKSEVSERVIMDKVSYHEAGLNKNNLYFLNLYLPCKVYNEVTIKQGLTFALGQVSFFSF